MIRLYRQTPEGIERTTQVDAAEQHLDSVFWIDLLTPEPAGPAGKGMRAS